MPPAPHATPATPPPGRVFFHTDALPRERWRNGHGWTRLLAADDAGAWRLSLADIDTDAPFSAFPGMQRKAVLLRGGGLSLEPALPLPGSALQANGLTARRAGELLCFDGDAALQARLHSGPVQVFNVMTRRGQAVGDLEVGRFDGPGSRLTAPSEPADLAVWLVVQGRWRLDAQASAGGWSGPRAAGGQDGGELSTGDGWLVRGAATGSGWPPCRPADADALALRLTISLQADR